MNRGPFGFPRVTDIGPFVDKEAEQTFTREEVGRPYYLPEYKAVAEAQGINLDNATAYRSSLKVLTEDKEPERSGILGDIEKAIDSIKAPFEVSHMRYFIHKDSGVATIGGVGTDEDFRRMGIATELKEKEMEFMRSEGVTVVFTDVVSDGGYNLSKNTGFKPIDEFSGDRGIMEFNREFNRGQMFKLL